jgi:hypothetical protein
MGWHRASIANGKTGETDWTVYDDYAARQGILTPNTEVAYVMAFPDLEKTGPLVLDYSPGRIVGIVMDYWQRPQFDYGLTGPEKGASGGRALLLARGQQPPADAADYHLVQMPTRYAFIGYRVMDRGEIDRLTPLNRIYPYAERAAPPPAKVLRATRDYTQSHPRGLSYWQAVNEIVQREPVEERDRFFLAMLRDLGMEKGKPFAPDDRQKRLLADAALLGEEITKALVYEKRFIGSNYRPDARWQFALVVDPDQREDNYDQLDERTDWFYEAIGCSYAMITNTPGVGSVYLSTYRDRDGDWLDGANAYRLSIAPNPPMQQFWAVSVYDIDTRNLFRNEAQRAEVSSNTPGLQANADGSVDVYFGPSAPSGRESNWVQTVSGRFWFPYFRLYAPTKAYFDRSWPLADIEKAR